MTRLSVNINKVATLRNARGGNQPNVVQIARDCERYGAQGITIHPRPDERHITQKDVSDLKEVVTTEFNIEGYPDERFLEIIQEVRPQQATLVPDPPDVLTSNAGWDTIKNKEFLSQVIHKIKDWGVRTFIFIEACVEMMEGAKKCGTDGVELYTENYACEYPLNPQRAIKSYKTSANHAHQLGLEINAGHDLNLENLKFFNDNISCLKEVSIGHALISDALYYGLENTIQLYKRQLV